jgi:hypothetical protein
MLTDPYNLSLWPSLDGNKLIEYENLVAKIFSLFQYVSI